MLYFWMIQTAFASPCKTTSSLGDFQTSLKAWESGIISQNMKQVKSNKRKALELLPCLEEKVTPKVAFQFHLLQGVMFWLSQQELASRKSFSAAKFSYANGRVSNRLFPSGHAIHEIYKKAPDVVLSDKIAIPNSYSFVFDGHQMAKRPMNAPTIFQLLGAENFVQTTYLNPSDAVPIPDTQSDEKQIQKVTESAPSVPTRWRQAPLRRSLLYTSAGLAVASVLFYAKAGTIKSNYHTIADYDPGANDIQQLNELYNQNQAFTRGAWVCSGLSISVGLGALLFK